LFDGGGKGLCAIAAQGAVDFLESMDQVHDFAPGIWAAGGGAEMGAAAKGAVFVDAAFAGGGVEQGTRAV
jgi:hypothetical protein